jgi:hypothetical protein
VAATAPAAGTGNTACPPQNKMPPHMARASIQEMGVAWKKYEKPPRPASGRGGLGVRGRLTAVPQSVRPRP